MENPETDSTLSKRVHSRRLRFGWGLARDPLFFLKWEQPCVPHVLSHSLTSPSTGDPTANPTNDTADGAYHRNCDNFFGRGYLWAKLPRNRRDAGSNLCSAPRAGPRTRPGCSERGDHIFVISRLRSSA